MIFIAGFAGAFIISSLSRSNPWILVGLLTLIALLADFFAIQGQLSEIPLWAKIIVVASVPLQMWLGGKIGIDLRNRFRLTPVV